MLQKILFSNFLGQNRQASPNLSELLEKPDSLARLLDEESFLSEFKSGSARTKEYMSYDRFVELTQMITIVGDENDKKRAYKFPLTVCDLLTSDNTKIQQLFLPVGNRVIVEERITKTVEKEVEQEVDDDEEEQEENKPEEQSEKIEGKEAEDGTALVALGEEKKKEGGDQEEEFGDFVEAPPKKKKVVKMKEVVEITEIVKHEKLPLINKLFEYFSRPINYTLTGYVSKVLVSLLNRKTLSFLALLFENPGQSSRLFEDIFSHLGSRSTVDLLARIYTIQNKSYLEQRYQLLLNMIDYLKKAENIDALANIAICVTQVFEKTNAHLKLGNPVKELSLYNARIPDLLSKLLEFFVGDNQNASTYSISIICQLLSYFNIKDQADKLGPFLSQYIHAVTNQLKRYLEVQRSRIGPHAIRLVQSLNICLKTDAILDKLADNTEIFPTLLALVRKYPLNNIFHNEVFKFISGSLSSSRPELLSSVINSTGLLQWLQEEAKYQQQRQKAKRPAKKGYFGHLFNFCQYLRQNAAKDTAISNITLHEKFSYIVKVLLEQEAVLEKKMLGGFSKKETKHTVMHSKESILEAHATFLASTPAAVLEKDLDDPTLNPILLEQLQRQLDGVEIPNQSQPEQVVQEQKHKAELIDENQHHKAAFWKVHLDYDVDGLIDELI